MPIQFVNPALGHTVRIGGSALTGHFGGELLSPLAVGLGNYLRSDTGTLLKDRLRQGDIPGAFSAVTGLGRSNAPRLEQYNPPGFNPNAPVTSADLLKSAQEVGLGAKREQRNEPPVPPAPPRLSPEEQAYNQERSRIAQLTAQNPEYQNIGQLRNDLRDQGMAIWQQKYGNTPMGQPGGAVGMYNPLMQQIFGYQTGSAPDQQMGAPTQGPTPNTPQVDQSLNPASPTFIGGEGAPLMDFTKENLTPEVIELYQKQLMEQARRK